MKITSEHDKQIVTNSPTASHISQLPLMSCNMTSKTTLKSKQLRGSPCLAPCDRLSRLLSLSVLACAVCLSYILARCWMQPCCTPCWSKASQILACLTLLNAICSQGQLPTHSSATPLLSQQLAQLSKDGLLY